MVAVAITQSLALEQAMTAALHALELESLPWDRGVAAFQSAQPAAVNHWR